MIDGRNHSKVMISSSRTDYLYVVNACPSIHAQVLSKLEIVEQLSSFVTKDRSGVRVDVSQLFATNQKHFFEMKASYIYIYPFL